jgi:hypothetical protein
MHRRVLAAHAAEQFIRAIGENLVHVHVVRGPSASLIRIDDELLAEIQRALHSATDWAPLAESVDAFERLSALDAITFMFANPSKPMSFFSKGPLHILAIDPNVLLIDANRYLDAMVAAANQPTREARRRESQAIGEELKARGLEGYYTICGDHTQRAMNQLHRRFGKNPKWKNLSCTVYVFLRGNENYSAQFLSTTRSPRCMKTMSLAEFEGQPGHKERTTQLKQQRCKDFGDVSPGQLGQLWSLAARTGPVWELILRIIMGDVVPPALMKGSNRRAGGRARLKPVKSAANSTNIGGLEDSVLVPLLEAVVNGHSTLQKLSEQVCADQGADARSNSCLVGLQSDRRFMD